MDVSWRSQLQRCVSPTQDSRPRRVQECRPSSEPLLQSTRRITSAEIRRPKQAAYSLSKPAIFVGP